ncbi:fungal-specific transcription factor domain-containing protein [Pyronema domesticum]|nr:fungal-specific transcription factor domain-containing protein [Pyronema domesticum]
MSSPDHPTKKRKRQRPIISCTECHRRKQKCDRQQPCGNCTLRSASHLCHYESKSTEKEGESAERSKSPVETTPLTADTSDGFGYLNGGNTAAEVLEKLDLDALPSPLSAPESSETSNYTRLLSLIPPRPYTSLLIRNFFTECNWLYGSVQIRSFESLLESFYESTASLSPGPQQLSQFPALLLQVCAISLQMLPREHFRQISQLCLGKDDFGMLSTRYSNAAVEMAQGLGRHKSTLPRVQTWFLRASWLKSEGRAIESWHALGQAIREAQEVGLHKATTVLGDQIRAEEGKRVWVNLYTWDRFMSIILGRPTLINDRHCTVPPPLDCDLTVSPLVPRSPLDPPTSFTERLLDYELAHIINSIDELPTNDIAALERLHSKLEALSDLYPPALAILNRDTKHDDKIPFLAIQAELLKGSYHCLVVGIHRPFVFTRAKSRRIIVESGTEVLRSQERLFDGTREHHHTIYTLNFFTFDPAVLIAAVLITSPSSLDSHTIDTALLHLHRAQERLSIIGRRVKLSEKGAAVLKLLIKKTESSIAQLRSTSPPATVSTASASPASTTGSTYYSGASSHESPASSISMMDTFPSGFSAGCDSTSINGFPDFAALGPINTGILSTRELDDILGGEIPEFGMDFNFGSMEGNMGGIMEEGVARGEQGGNTGGPFDGFWQNLLYVPYA